MEETISQLIFSGVGFLIGLVVGVFVGWYAHKYFQKAGNASEPLRTLFGIIIVIVWATAAIMSIFRGFDIPIYFHIFAGLVLAPMFDPEGRIIDKILGRGTSKK